MQARLAQVGELAEVSGAKYLAGMRVFAMRARQGQEVDLLSDIETIRAKIDEMRREHAQGEILGEKGPWCLSILCNQYHPGKCDALLGWEAFEVATDALTRIPCSCRDALHDPGWEGCAQSMAMVALAELAARITR